MATVDFQQDNYPPVFGIVFRNRNAGLQIFQNWLSEVGRVDEQERIRISIVRGIDQARPYCYRVVIGPNVANVDSSKQLFVVVNRVHTMEPLSPDNLDRFLNAYNASKMFFLAPVFTVGETIDSSSLDLELDSRIAIRQIHVRQAWEIGRNDIDAVAVKKGDVPIIPKNVKNAPVLEIL